MRWSLLFLAACGAAQVPHRPALGSIAGLARDHDSGTAIAKAGIHVRARGQLRALDTLSGPDGTYRVDHLAPGSYSLTAEFAGQPIDVEDIVVRAGLPTVVDLVFTLGRPDPVHVDFGDAREGAIDRYHPPSLSPAVARIEGTVNEIGTHDRVPGAVVTAVGGPGHTTWQTVSGDQGRYRFDDLPPGVYEVSAYYSIGGRGQIEVRRSDIRVAGAEAVIVPLWVELSR